ncbi:hypothetical protein AB5I41_21415 [Sphingomonas sp. MMS24-JH45]
MNDLSRHDAFNQALGTRPDPIGYVAEVAGSRTEIVFDVAALEVLARHEDPVLAATGMVGSRPRSGSDAWLIAGIRSLRLAPGQMDRIVATMDFLGEGDEERLTGRQLPSRRDTLSDAGSGGLSGQRRRPEARRTTPRRIARISTSASSTPRATCARRCSSMRCWASISRWSAPPAPASRPRRR